ncbi:hypothetical protein MZD87_08525 [Pediococcus pentosaceus]|uniref:hypothetical protein n=1 Tax=Pediococcus pentosaceus TaxID=1255 RepID=UPI00211A7D0D|nr:hypothetical protein [Pediococcus pentosaceus]MCQ9197126.1 hypothetical protein [Pediococcus pentosaceus]
MNTLNVSSWADFPLGGKSGLFNIVRPDARGQNDYDEGDIPFVASGSFNNGVMKYCSPKLNEKLDKKIVSLLVRSMGTLFIKKMIFLDVVEQDLQLFFYITKS